MTKSTFILFAFLMMSCTINAQAKKIGLVKLLNSDQQLELPTTAGNFTEKLGFQPNPKDDPNTKRGFYFSWPMEEEVEITFVELKDNNQYIGITAFTDDEIEGLPYNLVFNKSSFDEVRNQFKKLKPKWTQVVEEDNNYFQISFKDNNRFVYLYFYGDEQLLKVITVSMSELN